jgi:hypothetical protein
MVAKSRVAGVLTSSTSLAVTDFSSDGNSVTGVFWHAICTVGPPGGLMPFPSTQSEGGHTMKKVVIRHCPV